MNSKTQKAIAYLLVLSGSLYVSKELSLKIGCEIGYSRSHLNTYRLVVRINRTQSLYHYFQPEIDSHPRFIKQELSDLTKLKNYRYSTEITENSAFNQVLEIDSEKYLCAKNFAPLLSFWLNKDRAPNQALIGAVFFWDRGIKEDKNIICQSQISGWYKLNKPFLQDGKPVCGEGTTKFINE